MKQLKELCSFFKFAAKLDIAYVLQLCCNALVKSAQLAVNIVLPRYLIEELMGAQNTASLILIATLIIGANLLFAFLANTFTRLLSVSQVRVTSKVKLCLSQKIMNIEYRHLEDPYYLDLKERAQFAINTFGSIESLITSITSMVKNLVTVVLVLAILLSLSWLLVVILFITVAVMVLIQALFAKYQVKFFKEMLPLNRKYGYYVNIVYEPTAQKDYRLYNMGEMLGDRITQYNSMIADWFSGLYIKLGSAMGFHKVVGVLQTAIAYCYVGIRCISDTFGRRISIGELTMYVNAAINFGTSVFALGNDFVNAGQALNYLEPFFELMAVPDEADTCGDRLFEGTIEEIRFEHVSFTYPKGEKAVLSDISFTVSKGEKISVVGLNGAGKTTLVKLLCRLYRPDSGTIYINDIDIFEYEAVSFLRAIAAVFQDFKLFAFTVEENITCLPVGADVEKAQQIIDTVGLTKKVDELPEGLSTLLCKAYDTDATELSGGQMQKVAIARALYKDAPLIILDEPTSALDPIAEAEIYEQFNDMIGDRTALYISHRMSSSVFCDRILVIDGGSISDYDTHANLMKKTDSLYYKLFMAQARNFRETEG